MVIHVEIVLVYDPCRVPVLYRHVENVAGVTHHIENLLYAWHLRLLAPCYLVFDNRIRCYALRDEADRRPRIGARLVQFGVVTLWPTPHLFDHWHDCLQGGVLPIAPDSFVVFRVSLEIVRWVIGTDDGRSVKDQSLQKDLQCFWHVISQVVVLAWIPLDVE